MVNDCQVLCKSTLKTICCQHFRITVYNYDGIWFYAG